MDDDDDDCLLSFFRVLFGYAFKITKRVESRCSKGPKNVPTVVGSGA